MNFLAIDTSGKHLTVTACFDGSITEYYDETCGVEHSTSLMPQVERLLNGRPLGAADFIAAAVGPGSFTGIRIGVATVKALCYVLGKPCLRITSFEVLAYDSEGSGVCVIDARHGCYYAQVFENYRPVGEARFITAAELDALASEHAVYASSTVPHLTKHCNLKAGLLNAVRAKTAELSEDLETLEPLYIRKSQAEENR